MGDLDPTARAILRSVEVKKELLDRAGGALATGEVADLLGVTREAVHQRRRRGTLLAVETGAGEYRYPARQFTEDGTVPRLADALAAFHEVENPWTRLSVLVSGQDALGGDAVFDALRAGRVEEALEEIRRFGRM